MPDQPREWTLEGRMKKAPVSAVRQCKSCYAVFAPSPRCPSCGELIAVAERPRGRLAKREGELVEISADTDPRVAHIRNSPLKDLVKAARTIEQLQEIAEVRGFKPNWAGFMMLQKRRTHAKFRSGRAA